VDNPPGRLPIKLAERHGLSAGVPPGVGDARAGGAPGGVPGGARPREIVSLSGHFGALLAQVRYFLGHFVRIVHGTCAQSGERLSPRENGPGPAQGDMRYLALAFAPGLARLNRTALPSRPMAENKGIYP
jgi:hypothetical protein